MRSRSQIAQLENLFFRPWDRSSTSKCLSSSAVFVLVNDIVDSIKIERHIFGDLLLSACFNPVSIHILQDIKRLKERRQTIIPTTHASNKDILLDFKINAVDVQLASAIVNFNISISNFVVVKHILREMNLDLGFTFVAAQP
jgi:hypothetical protein